MGPHRPEKSQEYLKKHFRAMSDRDLARELGCSVSKVQKSMRSLGLARSRADEAALAEHEHSGSYGTTGAASKTNTWAVLISCVLIVLIAFGVYANAFGGSFHYDDDHVIVLNREIKNIKNIPMFFKRVWSRPLLKTTFALNYHFGKLNTWGYHFVNILLHSLNGILLFFLALKLLLICGKKKNGHSKTYAVFIAFGAALIHMTHPIHTESVAYIASRSSVMVTSFYLAAVLVYVRYLQTFYASSGVGASRSFVLYAVTMGLYFLGLLTKEAMVTLPAVLFVLEYCVFARDKKVSIRQVLQRNYVPFIAILLAGLVLRLHYYGTLSNPVFYREKWVNLLTEIRVVVSYVRLLFWPGNLNFDKDFGLSYFIDVYVFFALIQLSVICALAVWAWRYPRGKIIVFYILWFFITISPTSSIIPLQDVYTEHRLYLPSIGFSVIVAIMLWDLSVWIGGFFSRRKTNVLFTGCIVIIGIIFSMLTRERNLVYKDPIALWTDTVQKSPYKARPYNNLGRAYREKGETEKALKNYRQAVALWPEYTDALYNVANCYRDKEMFAEALPYYQKTIQLDPKYEQAYNNLGLTYQSLGRENEAIAAFKKAIEIDPWHSRAYNNLGTIYFAQRKYKEVIECLEKAIQIEPGYATAYFNLGTCYAQIGDYKKARQYFEKTLVLDPSHESAKKGLFRLDLMETQ